MTTTQPVKDVLTEEEFKAALPIKFRKNVNAALIQKINTTLADPDMYQSYRENLISYTSVLSDGKFKTENYIWAVKYVSFKLMGMTNQDAFARTFPKKVQNWSQQGLQAKDVAAYVCSYNKSKLVNLILEQTLIPTHVLNADMYQQALNIQLDIAQRGRSEMARVNAANSILQQLKPPEAKKHELEIKIPESNAIKDLRQATSALAAAQREAIEGGGLDAQQIAHSQIIEGEVVEVSE